MHRVVKLANHVREECPNTPRNSAKRSDETVALRCTVPFIRQPRFIPSPVAGARYGWREVHDDLEKGIFSGCYGWDHAAYWGIAEKKAGVDLREWYKKKTDDEYYLPEFKDLVDNPETKECWEGISTFDPMGFYAHPPTIAACKAKLDIHELYHLPKGDPYGVVTEDGIQTQKAGICYAWNLPRLAEKLNLSEQELRDALFKFSQNPALKDPKIKTYIPAVGGSTIYTFGDVRKLRDEKTEVSVRVHDECIGSDVFGSDICTCRPYLIFALEQCVMTAQRGGVGIVVYFRKEGRSLGEVIKFRVYNARENQKGGDQASTYFNQTESIAGIRDARFQVMMPDALLWLGVKRIDWLHSMSNEKYEAIVGAGIKVMQRVTLPDEMVKDNMRVEIDAKVMSGYKSESVDKTDVIKSTMSIGAVRKQAQRVYELAKKDELYHFSLDESKLADAVDVTEKTIREFYPDLNIPYHSRFRHFESEYLTRMVDGWECDLQEKVRRLMDLATVSVLLDAGAGAKWTYRSHGKTLRASEGLALASFDMFQNGVFSSDPSCKFRVNSYALRKLTPEDLRRCFQVDEQNPLISVEGRTLLLNRLGAALEEHSNYFGKEISRPGNMLDALLQKRDGDTVDVKHIWEIFTSFEKVWPKHATGISHGDVWSYSKLQIVGEPGSDLVPFHKLIQWLIYSIIEPIETHLKLKVVGLEEVLTPLAEYRNGGLLVDTKVLVPKNPNYATNVDHHVGSELITEWRALTVVLVDKIAVELRKRFNKTKDSLPMRSVLEGGTWRAGRIVARKLRPKTGEPPIRIASDGTVF